MFKFNGYKCVVVVGLLVLGACSGDTPAGGGSNSDTTPPVISNVAVTNITTTAATITWITSENAASQVEHGVTTAYGALASNPANITNHSVTLSGLIPNTLHNYRVISTDTANNTASSANATFTTLAVDDTTAPIISNITVTNITSTAATVSWMTDENSSSHVQYGSTTSYGSTANGTSNVTSHSVTLNNLTASTLYHYRVVSVDSAANSAMSTGATFTTTVTTPPPQGLIFFDNFEYDVGRNDPNAATLFQQQGLWTGAKTEYKPDLLIPDADGANGFLYTTTSIPGYSGGFPGGTSSRVLVMEARPGTEGNQTDFYLEYGDGENPAYDNTIPGNVWFQFWIYINNYGDQMSRVDARNKFIYPCNGSYPCQTGKWLISLVDSSYVPHWLSLGSPSRDGAFFMNAANTSAGIAVVTNTNTVSYDDRYKLGHTDISERVATNRWTLVKIHVDTSTPSARYEAWMRPLGGGWTKVVEWIDGVTPGFTWTMSAVHVGGHRTFRMPTTMGRANGSGYDSWYYMDDFAMAVSEAALPQYFDAPAP